MFRKISKDMEVKAPVREVWGVYSTLKLGIIIKSELSHLFTTDILEGDGGVGTLIKVTPKPGVSRVPAYTERFTKIDHEKMVKEVKMIEGGYLELGINSYLMRSEFFQSSKEESSIVRATIEYEENEDFVARGDASDVNVEQIMSMFEFANQYIENNKM